MATIDRPPLAACDICGAQAEKRPARFNGDGWQHPEAWGGIMISAVRFGTYPDGIQMFDVCPDCLKPIHAAVSAVIDARRKQFASRGDN